MNPLYEAQNALQNYCSNLVVLFEQSLEDYCKASIKREKESIFPDVKKYSSRLALLETFYCPDVNKRPAKQLQKLCGLLTHGSYQENDEEQIQLLTKIFRLLAQLPSPAGG